MLNMVAALREDRLRDRRRRLAHGFLLSVALTLGHDHATLNRRRIVKIIVRINKVMMRE